MLCILNVILVHDIYISHLNFDFTLGGGGGGGRHDISKSFLGRIILSMTSGASLTFLFIMNIFMAH